MNRLVVSPSPHTLGRVTVRRLMLDVILALLPAAAVSVWLFGPRSLAVIGTCVAVSVAAEALCRIILKRDQTVGDLSAAVTGLLLALNLPVNIPLWQAALGCLAAVVVVKQMFGGIGQNFVNPALVGRIVLLGSFPGTMTDWVPPSTADAVSSATPLAELSSGTAGEYGIRELLLGLRPGSLGETCTLALLAGGMYLIFRGVISPVIPFCYLGTVALTALLAGQPVWQHLLSGGLMLGAFFMATDYATSPVTVKGQIVYGIGCGLLTMLIRLYGALPEGISFAIVIMNVLVPLIERATRRVPFGFEKRRVRS